MPSNASTPASRPAVLLPLGSPALPKTLYTEVLLREKNESLKGDLLSFDDIQLTIHRAKDDRQTKWTDLTPASAFTLRARLIDKTNPRHWLALGEFGWGMGACEQARPALTKAAAMDSSLKPETDSILKTKPGTLIEPPPAKVTSTDSSPPDKPQKNAKDPTGELFPNVKGK